EELRIRIGWHKLGIPREYCIHLKDACGNTIFKECWPFDLGVTEFVLLENTTIPRFRPDVRVDKLTFRDKGNADHFALTGDVLWVSTIIELLTTALVRGALDRVKDFVERFLRKLFGNGDLADLLIRALLKVFDIIDKALSFVAEAIA